MNQSDSDFPALPVPYAGGPPAPSDLLIGLEDLAHRASGYKVRARGAGTQRAYKSAWRHYERWCAGVGRQPLDGNPLTVALYATQRAEEGLAVSSIRVALAAIRTAHLLKNIPLDTRHPELTLVMEGIARTLGTRPRRQAGPAVPDVLRKMMRALPSYERPLGARDRAMLLVGFGAAMRRSELVALRIGDIERIPDRGLRVTIRRSKTDQTGVGAQIAIWANPVDPSMCPALAFDRWLRMRLAAPGLVGLEAHQVAESPLFVGIVRGGMPRLDGKPSTGGRITGEQLSDKAVARLIKASAAKAGLDPARFSGHSLRSGLLTAAGDNRAAIADAMRQSRHKSVDVALAYMRPAELWHNNVTYGVFGSSTEESSPPT